MSVRNLRSSWIVLLGLVLACGGGKEPQGPWKVGIFVDLSGPTASYGESAVEGIRLAADEIEAAGGGSIELIVEDDRGTPDAAREVVEKLLDSGVSALIGSVTSSVTLAAAPLAQTAHIPMITPSATSPEVTKVGDYIFRVCFVDTFQGEAMAHFAHYSIQAKRAAILLDADSAYSRGLAQYFKGEFLKFGGETVAEETYAATDEDFRRQLEIIKAANPDVLFVPGYYRAAAAIARQAKELGISATLLGGDGWDAPAIFELGGEAVNGAFISNHFSVEASEAAPAFVEAYKARHGGKAPDAFAALAYDAMKVLGHALERAGSSSASEIRSAIGRTQQFKGVTGDITLNRERNALKDVVVLELRDGAFIYRDTVSPLWG